MRRLDLTFVCENAGLPKLKKVPLTALSRLKNARIILRNDGIQLHAQFKYRGGDWRLAEGGILDVYPHSCMRHFSRLLSRIQQSESA